MNALIRGRKYTESRDNPVPVAILVCESLGREMRMVARQVGRPYLLRVLSSLCHREPSQLTESIEQSAELLFYECPVFIAYGNCCHQQQLSISYGKLDFYNCAAALIGGNEVFSRTAFGTYFLTPFLALHWKHLFLHLPTDAVVDSRQVVHLKKLLGPLNDSSCWK